MYNFFNLQGTSSSSDDGDSDHDQQATNDRQATDIATDKVIFPLEEDEGEKDKIIPWLELPKQKWYQILEVRDTSTSFGKTKVLVLKNRKDLVKRCGERRW